MVRVKGFEPSLLSEMDPKSIASTNSATPAKLKTFDKKINKKNKISINNNYYIQIIVNF